MTELQIQIRNKAIDNRFRLQGLEEPFIARLVRAGNDYVPTPKEEDWLIGIGKRMGVIPMTQSERDLEVRITEANKRKRYKGRSWKR